MASRQSGFEEIIQSQKIISMKKHTRQASQKIEIMEDPFLCAECQKLGYCKDARRKSERRSAEVPLDDLAITDLVPLTIRDEKGKFSQEHLRAAYDAFHQRDYETAELHFRAVLEVNVRSLNANIGLAVTCYFLKKYEEAVRCMVDYESEKWFYRGTKQHEFALLCEKLLNEQRENEQIQQNTEIEKSVQQLMHEISMDNERAKPVS